MVSIEGHSGPAFPATERSDLPGWAEVGPDREAHIQRVADLLCLWADGLRLPLQERERWRAAAWLHDSLRDADPAQLRPLVPNALRDLPGPLLHGPAAAERIEDDDELRQAVRFHTVGHPSFGLLGKALYLADFLEPGRDFERSWRASLRARMPRDLDDVVAAVTASRIRHLLDRRLPVRPETIAFWNTLTREAK